MHRKLYYVHTCVLISKVKFKLLKCFFVVFFYIHYLIIIAPFICLQIWESWCSRPVLYSVHQTHECKKELDCVMVYGLPDIKNKSCPHLQFFTGTFMAEWQIIKKYFEERNSLSLVDSSIQSEVEKRMLNDFVCCYLCLHVQLSNLCMHLGKVFNYPYN